MATDAPQVRTRNRAVSLNNEGVDRPGQGTITVTRGLYHMGAPINVVEYTQHINVPVFDTTPALVGLGGGITRNMGDFNSARVEVYVQLPCYPEVSEIRRVKDLVSELVDQFTREELAIATGQNPDGTPYIPVTK